jgi:hypothetical protein
MMLQQNKAPDFRPASGNSEWEVIPVAPHILSPSPPQINEPDNRPVTRV